MQKNSKFRKEVLKLSGNAFIINMQEITMKKINFNHHWNVYQKNNTHGVKAIDLPHDAMLSETRTVDSFGGKNIGWFESHDYVYEKTFEVPDIYQEQSIVFEFEGVYHHAEIYINGKKAGYRPYGYTNFYVEADKYLKKDKKNKIEVYAYNSDQPNSRWYSGTGIYRPVHMYVLPKKHMLINGLKVKTINHEIPEIEVFVDTNDKGIVQIDILDGKKVIRKTSVKTKGQTSVTIPLPKAKLWDHKNPNLYTCQATFEEDIQTIRFGIRTIEVKASKGLLINGKRTVLEGACIHHDNGLLGAVAHPYAEYRKVKLLKKAGYNAIRCAHNPCSKTLLDACDDIGMLVLDEYVDMWYIHKTKNDYASYVIDWWQQDLKDMVDKDFNHPSVIMYSTGNEVSETAQDKGIEFTKQMTEYLHTLDDRPVTCGINIFFNFLSKLGFGVYSDKKAEQEFKHSKKKKKAVGSEFFNNLAGLLGGKFMKWGATLRGSDKNTYKAFANMDVAGYNYGIDRYKKDVKKYPDRIILGTETFCKDACQFHDLAEKYPAVIGDFVWAGMDYLGEVGIGAWVYEHQAPDFTHGPGWMTAGSGRIDILGNMGGEAAYTRVAFNHDPIRMAVVPVLDKKQKHSPSAWKMSNAIESWSFNGLEGKPAYVEVYAKAHNVELLLNDKKIAQSSKRKNGATFFIKTTYRPGTLTAVGYDMDGKEIGRTSLVTAKDNTVLNVSVEQHTVTVQKDLIYAHIKLTDEDGIVKPCEASDFEVSVENGELLGLGNACSYNRDGYQSHKNKTYFGEAMAIIKPIKKGFVNIYVNSEFGKKDVKVNTK